MVKNEAHLFNRHECYQVLSITVCMRGRKPESEWWEATQAAARQPQWPALFWGTGDRLAQTEMEQRKNNHPKELNIHSRVSSLKEVNHLLPWIGKFSKIALILTIVIKSNAWCIWRLLSTQPRCQHNSPPSCSAETPIPNFKQRYLSYRTSPEKFNPKSVGRKGGKGKFQVTMGESTLLTQVWPSKLTVPAFCTSARSKTLSYATKALDWKIPKIKGLKIVPLLALTSYIGTEQLCPQLSSNILYF